MRIINSTHWRTDQIAALIRRVAQDELDAGQLKHARVYVKYRRQNEYISGNCTYGTMRHPRVYMTLFLPRTGSVPLPHMAHTIAHELAHAKGLKHRDMNKTNRYGWVKGWEERYAYANEFPIEAKPVKAKPTLDDKRQKALKQAQQKIAEWTTKHKRAATTLKKWQKQAKAIERRLAKADPVVSAPPPSPDASLSF